MNEEIDWSKAPERAEAGYLGTSHAYDAWYKRDANGEVCQICPAAGFNDWVSMGGRKDFPVGAVLRPSAPAWAGIGLPPVGVKVEAYFPQDSQPAWLETTLLYVSDENVIYDDPGMGEIRKTRAEFDDLNIQFRAVKP